MSYIATEVAAANAAESTTNASMAAQPVVQGNDSKPVPSLTVDADKARVLPASSGDTDSEVPSTVAPVPAAQQAATKVSTNVSEYTHAVSVEVATVDDTNITAQTRAQYVVAFKRGVEKTAHATLETSRVVYEAKSMLDEYEFKNFCQDIGYRDSSSTIRKFIAIGKVYPRFIQYANQLPNGWTAIYQITQIPADDFEAMLKNRIPLDSLKGARLSELLRETRSKEDLMAPLTYDKDNGGHKFGTLVTTKKLDDIDWRAIEKGLNELAARLPIKVVLPKALLEIVEERRLQRYQNSKKKFTQQEFRPDTWDMGEEANAALPRPEPLKK